MIYIRYSVPIVIDRCHSFHIMHIFEYFSKVDVFVESCETVIMMDQFEPNISYVTEMKKAIHRPSYIT